MEDEEQFVHGKVCVWVQVNPHARSKVHGDHEEVRSTCGDHLGGLLRGSPGEDCRENESIGEKYGDKADQCHDTTVGHHHNLQGMDINTGQSDNEGDITEEAVHMVGSTKRGIDDEGQLHTGMEDPTSPGGQPKSHATGPAHQ